MQTDFWTSLLRRARLKGFLPGGEDPLSNARTGIRLPATAAREPLPDTTPKMAGIRGGGGGG